jgi:Xaa-Pro aminopeptidase
MTDTAGTSGAMPGTREREGTRVERLAHELRAREVDALLVDTPFNVRYLTGFTGSNGLALLVGDVVEVAAGANRFFTDFRYTTQSAEQVGEVFAREIVTGSLMEAAARSLGNAGGKLGFDEASLTVADHERLRAVVPQAWELVPCAGAVETLRAVKDADELRRIGAAAQLADEARGAAACGAARAADPARRAADDRLGGVARGLLLGLHTHVCDR